MMRIFDPAVANALTLVWHHSRRSRQGHSILSRLADVVGHNFRRVLCVILVVSLLATSTPAASQTIVGLAGEWQSGLAFWLRGNGLPGRLRRALTGQNADRRPQERQEDRDARVTRLQIYPGDTTIGLDDRIFFAAVPYDSNNSSVAGVQIKWSVQDTDGKLAALVSRSGEFEGKLPGAFRITAEAGGKIAQAVVIVLPTPGRPKLNELPLGSRRVSTRDLPSPASTGRTSSDGLLSTSRYSEPVSGWKSPVAHLARGRLTQRSTGVASGRMRQLRAHAIPLLPEDGWGSDNYWSADDPGNRRGDPPGQPLDAGSGSGNFQFAAPVLGLPGRGIDISLGLAYNSRVWNKAGTVINFDIDRDWPAPGWSLGFGKIADLGSGGSMIIDADGTRHAFSGTITTYSYGQLFAGHTTDGTLIQYSTWKNASGVMTWAEANLPNGSQIHYYTQGPGGVFPADIIDANGNYVNITYVNNTGPRIQTVSDTLGRVISFYYDSNNLLTAITTPALGVGTRELVRFHYHQLSLNYGFSGLTPVVRDSYPWVIDAIYYPATSTGYWFGDSDSYSSYGMLAKVVEQRGMGFSTSSLNDMGTVSQGQTTRVETYNYPLSPDYSLTDAPTYTSMVESWTRDGTNFDSATTAYEVHENSAPRTVTITLPNGTKSTQYSNNHPGQFDDGLIYYDETRDSNNNLLQSSSTNWLPGDFDSPRPTRVEATNERGQMTATEFSYGAGYNQVIEVRNYDYGGAALLRATRTHYENGSNYTTTRHIFNLPTTVEVFAADNTTRVSLTEYQYDGQTLEDTPGVVMHADNHNPYAPSGYNPVTAYRGNVTQVTSYADATGFTGAVTETRRYDITGNMIKASTSCCQQTTFSYTPDTQYGYPLSQTRGSATDPYAQVTTSATYDFNTGLTLSVTDANGRLSQTSYESATLRLSIVTLPTGAHTDYGYDDGGMVVGARTYLAPSEGGAMADWNVKFLNGRGQVRQEKALGAGGVWDFVDTVYDNMGRVSQQSRPYRNGNTQQWTTAVYDALGRTRTVTAPDGSSTQTFYNEASRPDVASSTPGETTRVQDAWGRERWGRTDASGRLVEVVEPNPSGNGSVATGGLVTYYGYNTLGNLTAVNQGGQTRSFAYDSLGRLTAQMLAEQSATLNDAGSYVGSGTWSDVFTYDDRSNLISRTDARGVKTVYSYNGDPLNRLQSVSWDTSGFGDTANPILSAATVSYQYRTKSSGSQLLDVTQPSSVTTSGVSTESYSYDSEGRVGGKTLTLSSRPSYPFATDYIFDTLDRTTDVRYPAEYGNGAQPRKVVHHDYDIASRLTQLTVDGQSQASNIVYNAASQTTQLNVGAGGANQIAENYAYNSQTGLLENQTVVRGGATTLLNLSYDYLRAGTNSGRTGQLTKILNNLNHNKDRGYTYDALGRLTQATGGPSTATLWTQTYSYDRYGNRTSVSASGYSAKLNTPDPQSTIGNRQLAMAQRGSSPTIREGASEAGSAGILPAMSAQREPGSSPTVREGFDFRSHHASSPTRAKPALPQGGPPVFTDDPLVPGVTVIKAVHITELRDAINQARARAGLSAASWAESVTSGVTIKASQIVEMRARLDEARAALGLSAASYTDPSLSAGMTVKAAHVQELRNRTREALGSLPIPRDGLSSVSYETASNRITTAGFSYDAAGNQTRALAPGGGSQRFQYDAANRLVKVKADDNVTVIASYTYGDSNERLIAEAAGSRTYYSGEGGAEYMESGSSTAPQWSKTYIYLGARLLSTLTPNGSGSEAIQFHHPDRLGTRLVTDPSNGTSFEQVTLPFGTALNAESTGSTNRRFTSYDRSPATGLDYAVNRHYDPQQGRFTQVDPIGMGASSLTNPQSLNMYSYVGNDPVNRTDPSGLFWGKLFHAIKKVLTSKWFIIALTVALAVITIGSAAFGWSLAQIAFTSLGPSGFGGEILVAAGHTATTLGWIAAGLTAALAIPSISFSARAILGNAIAYAAGIGISQVLSRIPMGTVGPGGTPGFNPNAGLGFVPQHFGLGAFQCPTGQQLLANKEVRRALSAAWKASNYGQTNPREQGGWIYMQNGRIRTLHQNTIFTSQAEIDLNNPPQHLMPGPIIGWFHTHPNPTSQGWTPGPSPDDIDFANNHGLPGLVRSDHGDYTFGPTKGVWDSPGHCL